MSLPLLHSLFLLGITVTVGLGAYTVATRRPVALVTSLLIVFVLSGSRDWPTPLNVALGGINVFALDVLTVLLAAVAVTRVSYISLDRRIWRSAVILTVFVTVGLLSWMMLEGFQTAVNNWRSWLTSLAVFWYAASWPQMSGSRLRTPFVAAALVASTAQAVGIAIYGLGSSSERIAIDGQLVSSRPVSAAVALLMLVGLIMLVLVDKPWTIGRAAVVTWLSVSVLIAQHRSVWVAALVSAVFVVAILVNRTGRKPRVVVSAALLTAAASLGMLALIRNQQQLSVASSNTDTLQWRLENWTEKLSIDRSPIEWLLGSVLGPTPVNDPGAFVQFTVSGHNMAVDLLTSFGVAGVVTWAVMVLTSINRRPAQSDSSMVAVPIAALLAFSLFYSWPAWAWLLIAAAAAQQPSPPAKTGGVDGAETETSHGAQGAIQTFEDGVSTAEEHDMLARGSVGRRPQLR